MISTLNMALALKQAVDSQHGIQLTGLPFKLDHAFALQAPCPTWPAGAGGKGRRASRRRQRLRPQPSRVRLGDSRRGKEASTGRRSRLALPPEPRRWPTNAGGRPASRPAPWGGGQRGSYATQVCHDGPGLAPGEKSPTRFLALGCGEVHHLNLWKEFLGGRQLQRRSRRFAARTCCESYSQDV